MPDRLSFIVLGGSGKLLKQAHLSSKTIYCVFAALVLACLVLGVGLTDYISIYSKSFGNEGLKTELDSRNQELAHQRQQLEKFAREINALKNHIVELNKLEQKIRAITNLDEPDNIFGVGGSTPEDRAKNRPERRPSQLIKDMHLQVRQLGTATVNQQNSFSEVLQELIKQKNIMSHTPVIQPAEGWITSHFGYRLSPFTGHREFHAGLDISNREGTPVVATANGFISSVGEDSGFGKIIVIDHGYGITTRYAHLDKFIKKRGEPVIKGDTIAQMGNSGRSTGPHVHYEVRLNGVPVNPKKYILN